jgi:RNA polymerase sigma-70 factor, ECF subfamily
MLFLGGCWTLYSVMDARRDFEQVYAACEPAVRAFVWRRIGPDGVDDVVSEVFLAAWRRHGEIPCDPLPWLLNVSRGVVANRRRSRGRGDALLQRLTREELASVAARSAEVDLGVADALARMSAADQELLLLVAWEGLSGAQLAAAVGAPRATVAMRLSRARRRFAQAFQTAGTSDARRDSSNVEVLK